MSVPDQMRDLLRYAKSQGWHVEKAGSGHTRLTRPDGVSRVIPSTPSDYRSLKNSIAQLRQIGLDLPRKAPKPKLKIVPDELNESRYNRRAACEAIGILPVLDPWPNVTRIVGQWRDPSWFEDGQPLPEREADEYDIACFMTLRHVDAEVTGEDPASYEVAYTEVKTANRPTGKRLRIAVDTYRFWGHTSTPPRRCTCGSTYADEADGPLILAQHIVNEHERGYADHEPVHPDLTPWVDPNELAEMAEDPLAEEIEALRRANERLVCEREMADRRYNNLRGDLLAVLNRES